ncbi:hypothetical protein HXX76_003719 [Chlamydomonas incerta]|uniref:phytol kinase n=1 Tax=Chlamydomonas incerta TaxID=51695 RepID=A0A835TL55_CHLIN|nr:hypothetical protein HXX76_003719 [Chlamydomonas incerta]|eukprot:KAG2440865.1 hypothetical protein HXX76_003719 [Chlamydomonas incerta]
MGSLQCLAAALAAARRQLQQAPQPGVQPGEQQSATEPSAGAVAATNARQALSLATQLAAALVRTQGHLPPAGLALLWRALLDSRILEHACALRLVLAQPDGGGVFSNAERDLKGLVEQAGRFAERGGEGGGELGDELGDDWVVRGHWRMQVGRDAVLGSGAVRGSGGEPTAGQAVASAAAALRPRLLAALAHPAVQVFVGMQLVAATSHAARGHAADAGGRGMVAGGGAVASASGGAGPSSSAGAAAAAAANTRGVPAALLRTCHVSALFIMRGPTQAGLMDLAALLELGCSGLAPLLPRAGRARQQPQQQQQAVGADAAMWQQPAAGLRAVRHSAVRHSAVQVYELVMPLAAQRLQVEHQLNLRHRAAPENANRWLRFDVSDAAPRSLSLLLRCVWAMPPAAGSRRLLPLWEHAVAVAAAALRAEGLLSAVVPWLGGLLRLTHLRTDDAASSEAPAGPAAGTRQAAAAAAAAATAASAASSSASPSSAAAAAAPPLQRRLQPLPPPAAAAAAAATAAAATAAAAGPPYTLSCALRAGWVPLLEAAVRGALRGAMSGPGGHNVLAVEQACCLLDVGLRRTGAFPALLAHGDLRAVAALIVTLGKATDRVSCVEPQVFDHERRAPPGAAMATKPYRGDPRAVWRLQLVALLEQLLPVECGWGAVEPAAAGAAGGAAAAAAAVERPGVLPMNQSLSCRAGDSDENEYGITPVDPDPTHPTFSLAADCGAGPDLQQLRALGGAPLGATLAAERQQQQRLTVLAAAEWLPRLLVSHHGGGLTIAVSCSAWLPHRAHAVVLRWLMLLARQCLHWRRQAVKVVTVRQGRVLVAGPAEQRVYDTLVSWEQLLASARPYAQVCEVLLLTVGARKSPGGLGAAAPSRAAPAYASEQTWGPPARAMAAELLPMALDLLEVLCAVNVDETLLQLVAMFPPDAAGGGRSSGSGGKGGKAGAKAAAPFRSDVVALLREQGRSGLLEALVAEGRRQQAASAAEGGIDSGAWDVHEHAALEAQLSAAALAQPAGWQALVAPGHLWRAADEKLPRCDFAGCKQLLGDSEREVRLKRCGRCGAAAYCCAECQRADWAAGHKQACRGARG